MRPTTRWLPLIVALLGLAMMTGADGITEEEFVCEVATARLAECCPGFDPKLFACYREPGCNSPADRPDFTEIESRCILKMGCDDLRAIRVCKRAAARATCSPRCSFGDAGTSSAVCP